MVTPRRWCFLALLGALLPGCRACAASTDEPQADTSSAPAPSAAPPVLPEPGGDQVQHVALTADSRQVAVASSRGLTVWSLLDGKLVATAEAPEPSALAWAPNGRRLAFATGRQVVLLEPKGEGRLAESARLDVEGTPRTLTWRGPDTLLVLSDDGVLREYLAKGGAAASTLGVSGEPLTSASIAAGADRVAIGRPRGILVTELETRTEVSLGKDLHIRQVALPRMGRSVAAVDQARPRSVLVWDTELVATPRELTTTLPGDIEAIEWLPDGSGFVVASDAQAVLLDARSGKQLASFALPGTPTALRVSPDGRSVVVGASSLRVFDRSGKPRWRTGGGDATPHALGCVRTAVALLDNEAGLSVIDFPQRRIKFVDSQITAALALNWTEPRRIDVALPSSVIGVYPVSGGRERAVVLTGVAERLVWSPNGQWLAGVRGDGEGKLAALWRRGTGEVTALGAASERTDFAFSASGDEVAFTDGDAIAVHAVPGGATRRRVTRATPPEGGIDALAWSPAGDLFAVHGPSGRGVDLFDARDGVRARHLESAMAPVTFSSDGAFVVDRTSRLIETRSGKVVVDRTTRPDVKLAHKGEACFSPDGAWAAVAARAGVLFLRRTGERVHLVRVAVGATWQLVALGEDGRFEGSDAALSNLILMHEGQRRRAIDLPRYRFSGLMVALPAR